MAFAGKAVQRDGWDSQAEHLALTHTAFGMAALAVAQQARRRPALRPLSDQALAAEPESDLQVSEVDLPNDGGGTTAANRSEFEQQATRRALIARIHTLTALRLAAKKQIAELDGELGSAREDVVLRDNENRSLQASLDLITNENTRLSERLAESEAAIDKSRSDLAQMKAAVAATEAERDGYRSQLEQTRAAAAAAAKAERDKDRARLDQMKAAIAAVEVERDKERARLDQMKAAIAAAEAQRDTSRAQLEEAKAAAAAATAERNELAAAIEQVYKKRDTETTALNTYLDVMRSRAADAEQLLEETQQSLAAHAEQNTSLIRDNSRLARSLADSNTAVETAHSQLDQMKSLLAAAIAERDKLVTGRAKANESHQTEIGDLKICLESACSRAASAETLLAEVRQSLLEKLELLQKSLQTKICQVEELKQSRAKLIEDARILLKSVDARDWALAEANGKIKLLAELVAEPRTRAIGQVQSYQTDVLLASTVTF